MKDLRNIALIIVSIIIIFSASGCKSHIQQSGMPMPVSAKQESNNVIDIPFPYSDKLSNGEETWMIQKKHSPDNIVLDIIYPHTVAASFPLNSTVSGTYSISGTIKFDGKEYEIIDITLNNDLESGTIRLRRINPEGSK